LLKEKNEGSIKRDEREVNDGDERSGERDKGGARQVERTIEREEGEMGKRKNGYEWKIKGLRKKIRERR